MYIYEAFGTGEVTNSPGETDQLAVILIVLKKITHCTVRFVINQAIKGPHKATHGQGEATFQHHYRGQQTLRHEVTQAWGAVAESQQQHLS